MRIVVGDAYAQGAVSLDRSLLLENALDFDSTTARMVMTPLARAAALDLARPWAENQRVIADTRLSRYLLLDGGLERIVGVVLLKDLALETLTKGELGPLDRFRRELTRVPADCALDGVLRVMQRERSQFAIVLDGGTPIGIVTLEDVLEELVGEIHDEFEERRIWNLGDHLAPAATLVDVLFKDIPGAVRTLVNGIVADTPGLDAEAAVKAVLKREAQASTSVGHGVALPHARIPGLARTRIGLARVEDPMPWRQGGELVRFVFLILSPEEQPIEQVRALSRIATLVRDEALFARLDTAPGVEGVVEVVRAADVVAA
jgi:CPA2 family monovalent cation:H+ antiporter-2